MRMLPNKGLALSEMTTEANSLSDVTWAIFFCSSPTYTAIVREQLK